MCSRLGLEHTTSHLERSEGQINMLKPREIKEVLRELNIRPSKRLGQNFLVDKNTLDRILNSCELDREDNALEIGPGFGALTEELAKRVKGLTAIEKDGRLYNYLVQKIKHNNLEIVHGDILKFNFKNKVKVIGNLPYYISSPILTYLLNNRRFVDSVFITVQKEFAERLVAGPGSKQYGAITCFTQFYSEPVILFRIKRNAFYPAPEVDSCFMKARLRKRALFLTDEEKLFKIIRACFGKRRKTIFNSLRESCSYGSRKELVQRLDSVGISSERRPETLSLEEFVKIAKEV